jgi:hypothetical protein
MKIHLSTRKKPMVLQARQTGIWQMSAYFIPRLMHYYILFFQKDTFAPQKKVPEWKMPAISPAKKYQAKHPDRNKNKKEAAFSGSLFNNINKKYISYTKEGKNSFSHIPASAV